MNIQFTEVYFKSVETRDSDTQTTVEFVRLDVEELSHIPGASANRTAAMTQPEADIINAGKADRKNAVFTLWMKEGDTDPAQQVLTVSKALLKNKQNGK